MRLATRHHANGWMSVVEERRDGDDLHGFAVAPDGLTHRPDSPALQRKSPLSYEARKAAAQAAADKIVAAVAGHCDCRGCEPWEDWPDTFAVLR